MTKTINREQWLQAAVSMIRLEMTDRSVAIPQVQVSCSWPGGGSARKRIGECWPRKASKAGVNEIFISPKIEDSARVLGILAHELAHAVDDCAHMHRKPFADIGRAMGLEGKPTQMVPPQATLEAWAVWMAKGLGPFPHRTLDKSKSPTKTQATRMIKCECRECGAVWRMSATVINSAMDGALSCPVCHEHECVNAG